MNIHGYKLKRKGMQLMIRAEMDKPVNEQNKDKLRRLIRAKHNCCGKIKALKRAKNEEGY